MRYLAPLHTSSISAPTRDIAVDGDGFIELPDDAPEVEHDYLRRAGCALVAAGGTVIAPEAEKAPQPPENETDGDISEKSKPKS